MPTKNLDKPLHCSELCKDNELKSFSRSMAELQWLMLIIVMVYFFTPTHTIEAPDTLIGIMSGYAVFVLLFRYAGTRLEDTPWKLAIETWAMISFITLAIWQTGGIESPLQNLYLISVIACAITLGKTMTILEVALIACCYLYMGYYYYSTDIFSGQTFTFILARFSPLLLVAYVTSILASDILNAKKRITELSQTDDLTGILNMRAFNEIFEKEIASAARYAYPLSVLMIDLDKLKLVNDQFGHTTGSDLIRHAASLMKNGIREADILARYGGDEFVILMPHTDARSSALVAERIRKLFETNPLNIDGHGLPASVSIGIASYPENVSRPETLLDKADAALYRSKTSGRNRSTACNDMPKVAQVQACA
jgi:diguanylate cyclase (GGDEF)-like protein